MSKLQCKKQNKRLCEFTHINCVIWMHLIRIYIPWVELIKNVLVLFWDYICCKLLMKYFVLPNVIDHYY